MSALIYPWQQTAWRRLQEGKQPQHHALLIHGPAGIGKRRFVEVYAQSLLCADPDKDGLPCGRCSDCRWLEQQAHPDFRLLTPDALRVDAVESPGTADEDAARGEKKASNQITIDQVRGLQDFLGLTAHRAVGSRVIVIQPADTMNIAAANALLKMLEEPPARTLFLLVTDEIRRLLPTILSRCRRYPMPVVNNSVAYEWLKGQGVSDAGILLAQAGGAPVAALAKLGDQNERELFLDRLSNLAGPDAALDLAAAAQKLPLPTVLSWLVTWCYDLLAARVAGEIRYHPDYAVALMALASVSMVDQLLRYQDRLKIAVRSVAHPLNPRLFLEQLLLSYSQTITPPSAHGYA